MKSNDQFSQLEESVIRKLYEALPSAVHAAVQSAFQAALQAPDRETRNGVKAPVNGGKCWTVWSQLDKLLEKGSQPTLQQALDLAATNGWNKNNTRIEFYQWRHFHGYGKILNDQVEEKRQQDRRVRKARPRSVSTERRHLTRRIA